MPPKKATNDVASNVVAFGRVRKNLKMGCVGLPNVGKSSLFNLLTEQNAAAENYPFCTIEPNEARCPVPDARYVCLCVHFGVFALCCGGGKKRAESGLIFRIAKKREFRARI